MFAWRAHPAPSGEARPGAYLTVPALERAGIRASFTTRLGGVSEPPFDSLNLSFSSGDDPERVRANRARALATVGLGADRWTGGAQVHGTSARRVGTAERGAGADDPSSALEGTDALWTDEPGIALVAVAADCMPILLADPDRGRVGVVHAGWRGLTAGVVESCAGAMGGAESIAAFIGPSIGPCCYEVGEEVAERAAEALGPGVLRRDPPRASPRGSGAEPRVHLDLWSGAILALRRAGVRRIWPAALCTRCEPDRFYSHRAGSAGRQAIVACLT